MNLLHSLYRMVFPEPAPSPWARLYSDCPAGVRLARVVAL